MSRKKLLILIVIVFFLILFGFFIWLFWKSDSEIIKPIRDRVEYFIGISKRIDQPVATTSPDIIDADDDFRIDKTVPKLRQITKEPVAGAVIFERIIPANNVLVASTTNSKNQISTTSKSNLTTSNKIATTTESVIRFMDRATGNIFETKTNTLDLKRLINKTIPTVYSAKWDKKGEQLIFQQLDENDQYIKSFIARITVSTSTNNSSTSTNNSSNNGNVGNQTIEQKYDLVGFYLPNSLIGSVISPDSKNIFTLEQNYNSGSLGFIQKKDGADKKQIYSSFFKGWLIDWFEQKNISLNSKPSYNLPGYLYFLNPENGTTRPVLWDIIGLTSNTSPNGKYILYSGTNKKRVFSLVYLLNSGMSFPLDITTLPEKCAWGQKQEGVVVCGVPSYFPEASYPDDWYKGIISFDDEIWIYDLNDFAKEKVNISPRDRVALDIINPQLSEDNNFLLFQNKKDLSLWILDLRD